MQVECECCKTMFWMSARCHSKHPKCQYCRQGMDPEESQIYNEMDECWDLYIQQETGQSYAKPDSDFILSWATKLETEEEMARINADEFFYSEAPSSDK